MLSAGVADGCMVAVQSGYNSRKAFQMIFLAQTYTGIKLHWWKAREVTELMTCRHIPAANSACAKLSCWLQHLIAFSAATKTSGREDSKIWSRGLSVMHLQSHVPASSNNIHTDVLVCGLPMQTSAKFPSCFANIAFAWQHTKLMIAWHVLCVLHAVTLRNSLHAGFKANCLYALIH